MRKRLILLLICAFGLSACDDVKTVEYWQKHTKERDKYRQKCMNNPAKARQDGNCINIGYSYLADEAKAIEKSYDESLNKGK